MSGFADRARYSLEEVTEIHKEPTNAITHVLDNGDGTYSLMYHIVCEHCDYCAAQNGVEGRWWDNNGFIIHPAKENPYEDQEKRWNEEEISNADGL